MALQHFLKKERDQMTEQDTSAYQNPSNISKKAVSTAQLHHFKAAYRAQRVENAKLVREVEHL